MNLFKKIIWWLYIWLFVPKDLWYYDRHNNTVIVVPARKMEDIFRIYNNEARRGVLERIHTHIIGYNRGRSDCRLIFSDNRAYIDGVEERTSAGVAGTLEDFDRFRYYFRVQPRALFIPSASSMRQEGRMMGCMYHPETFSNVLQYAEELCQHHNH